MKTKAVSMAIHAAEKADIVSEPARLSKVRAGARLGAWRFWFLALELTVVGAIIYSTAFHDLGATSIDTFDEAMPVRVTEHMLATGEWFRATIHDKPIYAKPPFKMWLSMIPVELLGPSNFSYRLLDAILAALTGLLLFTCAKRLFPFPGAGLLAVLTLFGSVGYVNNHGIRQAVQESMLAFLSFACFMIGLRVFDLLKPEKKQPSLEVKFYPALAFGLICGLAALTKSVAGFLPLVVVGVFFLLKAGKAKVQHWWAAIATLAVSVAIPALYFVPHFLFTPGAYREAFSHEVVRRAVAGFHNQDSPFFYLKVLFFFEEAAPALLLGGALIVLTLSLFRKESRSLKLYLLCWIVVPTLLYSIPSSRLPWYIVPSFPVIALVVGGLTASLFEAAFLAEGRFVSQRLTKSLTSLGLVCFSLFLLISSYVDVLERIEKEAPRTPFDQLQENLLSGESTANLATRVSIFGAPTLTAGEQAYLAFLRRPLVKTEDFSSLKNSIAQRDEPHLVLAGVNDLEQVLALPGLTQWALLEPTGLRETWNIAALFSEQAFIPGLRSQATNYAFARDSRELLHGFGNVVLSRGRRVREMRGKEGGFLLPGDAVLRALPSRFGINLRLADSYPNPNADAAFYLNGVLVGRATITKDTFSQPNFLLPAGSWRTGKNAITIRLIELVELDPHEPSVEIFRASVNVQTN